MRGRMIFRSMAAKYPQKFAVRIGYDNALAHKIEAGADFVMPSNFEPCGLNQMYSLRYGTPPIVGATGGLDDTIENLLKTQIGDGFKFFDATPAALLYNLRWGGRHTYYNDKEG